MYIRAAVNHHPPLSYFPSFRVRFYNSVFPCISLTPVSLMKAAGYKGVLSITPTSLDMTQTLTSFLLSEVQVESVI